MSYQQYVMAAYGVFVAVMAWDFFAPRFQLRAQVRAATLRAAREASRAAPSELTR